MELYILDSLYRRNAILDGYKSMIWTERFSDIGDTSIVFPSTLENRQRLQAGTLLGMSESNRVMVVETYQDGEDASGERTLTLKGRSLEKILEDRVAAHPTDDTWVLTGLPAVVARQIFHDICVTGTFNSADVISGVTEGTFYSEDTLAEPDDTVEYSIDPTSVYLATKNLCDPYFMGFRLVKNADTSMLYYDIYMGSDRTTQQTDFPAIVFSQELDTLQSPTELTTIALYKNVAYVFSKAGRETVYPLDIDPGITGFERRAMFINMTDIQADEDPDVASAKMIQKGKEELYKNRQISAFDGEVNEYSSYKYEDDYFLGDVVEMQNIDGVRNRMRVTEQIFVSDELGTRSYPTLTLETFITPGSWAARPHDQYWADVPSTEHWADLP